ncbi:hypothetical protein TSUD_322770 [Trifolium subterraneum]|uniref:Uncharacterized protein n=1 Tax=Trifolium subterraneum TaxID=3900 RepID=A0A2Z6MZT5_TRISU|nr:hypothetical protein TSUD_322770 [Trifolium subterraneum]
MLTLLNLPKKNGARGSMNNLKPPQRKLNLYPHRREKRKERRRKKKGNLKEKKNLRKTWQVLKTPKCKNNLQPLEKKLPKRRKKKHKKSHSKSGLSIANTSAPTVETKDAPEGQLDPTNGEAQANGEEISPPVKEVEDTGIPKQVTPPKANESSPPKTTAEGDTGNMAGSSIAKNAQPQMDPSTNANVAATVTPATTQNILQETSLVEETIIEPPNQALNEVNIVVTEAGGDGEEKQSNEGEHSSTKDHHQPDPENEEESYDVTDDFLNSSAEFLLPSHVLQSVKSLAPEDALAKLLDTYGTNMPIANDKRQELQREQESLELQFRKDVIEGNMLTYVETDPTLYFNHKSLFHKLQTRPISEAFSLQVTQAENFLDQYARNFQHFTKTTNALNDQITARAKHYNLASRENAEVNNMKAASTRAFLQIIACEDNIARWRTEIRELEGKIAQEEETEKLLADKAVEVPRTIIEDKEKLGIQHYSEAIRVGLEVNRLAGEKNALQGKLTHTKGLYDQFRRAHL